MPHKMQIRSGVSPQKKVSFYTCRVWRSKTAPSRLNWDSKSIVVARRKRINLRVDQAPCVQTRVKKNEVDAQTYIYIIVHIHMYKGEILYWCIVVVDWLVCWDYFDTCSIEAAFCFMLGMGCLGFFSIFFDNPKEFLADVPPSIGLNLKHGPGD